MIKVNARSLLLISLAGFSHHELWSDSKAVKDKSFQLILNKQDGKSIRIHHKAGGQDREFDFACDKIFDVDAKQEVDLPPLPARFAETTTTATGSIILAAG